MGQVVSLRTPIDEAYDRWVAARQKAAATAAMEDVRYAARCFERLMDLHLSVEKRWPRDPDTLRMLTPSEIQAGKASIR
ncbi:hypothetical protein [Microvirga zambiensis]|uniref:hypothetical protein n=1 Tax=Microvirga zambiensis TaxID=1402137 RepID=UPI00191CC373|nr:hypothetical protein [Microvirga zambiensis]